MKEKRNKLVKFEILKKLIFLVLLISLSSFTVFSTCDDGMGKLSIYVSAMDDPCKLETTRTWYITIYNCDGSVLDWCGKRYVVLPAKCGHLEVKVPPGCYYIKGVWSFWAIGPGIYRVNHYTDAAIVQASCGKTKCVKLFNPSAHRCGTIFALAIKDLIKMGVVRPDVGKRAINAINNTLKQIPIPLKKFELGHEDEILKLQEQNKENK